MKRYQTLTDETEKDILRALKEIIRLRNTEDIGEFNNLDKILIRGRKVNKVPTSSSDVVVGMDVLGDFNATATFLYILIDNAGTIQWRRVALSSF